MYGYAENRTLRIRTGKDGLLRMLRVGTRELLPPSTDPNDGCNTAEMNEKGRYCFETGKDYMLQLLMQLNYSNKLVYFM